MNRNLGCVIGLALLLARAAAAADPADTTASRPHIPRVGLALSGGGAKGLAHVGALKVIEEAGVPISYVTGTSMGAVVGALYAAGYPVAEIEAIVLGLEWNDLFDDRIPRRDRPIEQKSLADRFVISLPLNGFGIGLPRGVITGQRISTLLERLTLPVSAVRDFSALPIPFACLATDLITGEAVVLDHGDLSEALRASMAIPTAFTPVELDGRLLVDGMVGRNLPIQDALAMGADVVIGVDVGRPLAAHGDLDDLVKILGQAVVCIGAETNVQQRDLCNVLITPDLDGVTSLDFSHPEVIIAAGEAAARAVLPQLRALAVEAEAAEHRLPIQRPVAPDSFTVRGISVSGLAKIDTTTVLAIGGLHLPVRATAADVERAVARVYDSGMFERIAYYLDPVEGGVRLRLAAVEKTDDYFRFGMRYDDRDQLTAILGILYRNRLGRNSLFNVDVIVGGRTELIVHHFVRVLTDRSLSLGTRIGVQSEHVEAGTGGDGIVRCDLTAGYAEILSGGAFNDRFGVGFGARGEWVDLDSDIPNSDLPSRRDAAAALVGVVYYDTLDRSYFPTRGISLYTRHDIFEEWLGTPDPFTRHYFDMKAFAPLSRRFALTFEIAAGATSGGTPTFHDQFFLGGMDTPAVALDREATRISFLGLRTRQLYGENFRFAQVGTQLAFGGHYLILARANAGDVRSGWRLDPSRDRFESGAGLTLARLTPLGPIDLTCAYGSAEKLLGSVNIGMKF